MMKHALLAALLTGLLAGPALAGSETDQAERANVVLREAIVETVDLETRQVLLEAPDGRTFTIVAGPEVRNLEQLKPNDKVELAYYEAVALKMAAEGDPGGGVSITAAERAEVGEKPGLLAESATNMVIEFLSYDPDSTIATFIGPDEIVHSIKVHPKMQAFAKARKTGDLIEVAVEQALAISVKPLTN